MSVNHLVNIEGCYFVASCEWCETPASYRVKRGTYQRFACDVDAHRVRTQRLARLDHGDVRFETVLNPTGFSDTGRMLGTTTKQETSK